MKKEVKNILNENGKIDFYTEERFNTVKELMKLSMKRDVTLKAYLSIDPYYKAKFIADHIIKLASQKLI